MDNLLLFLCLSAPCMISAVEDERDYSLLSPHLQNVLAYNQRQPEPHRIQKRQADSEEVRCRNVILNEICTNGLYQDFSDVVRGCGQDTEFPHARCTQNFLGGFCDDDKYYNIERVCNSPCSPECRELLVSAGSELGCCIASIYNDSSVSSYYQPAIFNFTLWSSCGVEPVTHGAHPVWSHCLLFVLTLPATLPLLHDN